MKRAFCICGNLLLATAASAALLNPGDIQFKPHPSVPPGGSSYSTELPPFGDGANLIAELAAPLSGEFEGTVTSQVFRDPATNVLSFHYSIALTDMNPAAIVRATMDGWAGVTITDVGADASGSSGTFDPAPEWTDGDPLSISRDPQTEGLSIQWRSAMATGLIGTVVGPGDLSSVAFFVTDVTDYTQGEMDLIDTAVTGEANVLVPIPEPASIALLGLGVLGFFHRRRA
jgi:hypothetical protein